MRFKAIIILSLLLVSGYLGAKEKLIFAIDMIRHGDRTPLRNLDKAPHHWKEGMGQLTARGMHQEFELGKSLRQKYIGEHALLPEKYQAETIYIRSTDYDRTLMSAQCLLMGLYPIGTGPLSEGYQPIPIHTQSVKNDELIPNEVYVRQFNDLLESQVYQEPLWQEKTAQTLSKWQRWSDATGMPINNLRDIVKLSDVLYVHQLHQAPMPAALSKDETQQIIHLGKWAMAMMYKSKEVGDLLGQGQLAIIAQYLQEASEKKNSLKYVLLSAHDSSILSLMSALEAPLEMSPRYASHVSFSLFENENKSQYIKVSMNDVPVPIPACGGFVCSLEKLTTLVKKG